MRNKIKAKGIHFISFIIIYMCLYFLFLNLMESMDRTYLTGITFFIAIIISPKTKVITTQSGDKIQITWMFLKKPILI